MTVLICPSCGQYCDNGITQCTCCGTARDELLTEHEVETKYQLTTGNITSYIERLSCKPGLGIACYRLDTGSGVALIECPSVFDSSIGRVDAIFLSHADFAGASDQYCEAWGAEVFVHELDDTSIVPESRCCVYKKFSDGFTWGGIGSYRLGETNSGATVYVYKNTLFVCDFSFRGMAKPLLITCAKQLTELAEHHDIKLVCGYNFAVAYSTWAQPASQALNDIKRNLNF